MQHRTTPSAPPSHEGIVTLADANYFPGLETLYLSAQQSRPMRVTCFDIGLTKDQRQRATAHCPLLDIQPIPDTDDIRKIKAAFEHAAPLAKVVKRVWPLWICPFLIAAAPYRRTFWIDADVVILRDLDGLFAMLDAGPVFTIENNAPEFTPNKPALYQHLPIPRAFDQAVPVANGGVSGWDLERDREVLQAYMHPIRQACQRLEVRESISWHDQGALIWAIQRHGLEHRVLRDPSWNLCIRHSPARQRRYAWGPGAIEELRQADPSAHLLHWNGHPVPWTV